MFSLAYNLLWCCQPFIHMGHFNGDHHVELPCFYSGPGGTNQTLSRYGLLHLHNFCNHYSWLQSAILPRAAAKSYSPVLEIKLTFYQWSKIPRSSLVTEWFAHMPHGCLAFVTLPVCFQSYHCVSCISCLLLLSNEDKKISKTL